MKLKDASYAIACAILVPAALLLLLTACGSDKAEGPGEDLAPPGYEIVDESLNDLGKEDWTIATLKHVETGCYFTVVSGFRAVTVQQIYTEKNGVAIPYCKKE